MEAPGHVPSVPSPKSGTGHYSARHVLNRRFSSLCPNPFISFECFSNIERKNEGIISEAKTSQTTANFGKALLSLSQSAD